MYTVNEGTDSLRDWHDKSTSKWLCQICSKIYTWKV